MLSSPNRGEEREGIEDSRPGPLRAGRWLFPHVLFPERSKATILSQCKMRKLKSEEGPANSPRSQSSSERTLIHLTCDCFPGFPARTRLRHFTPALDARGPATHRYMPGVPRVSGTPSARVHVPVTSLATSVQLLAFRDSFHLTVTWPQERGY